MTSSTAIYTCYRQLHPPTGIDHAVFGSVTSPGSRDLVVGKASILELYKVHCQSAGSDLKDKSKGMAAGKGLEASDAAANAVDDDARNYFLELAGTFPLAGNISALSVVPVPDGGSSSRNSRDRDNRVSSTTDGDGGDAWGVTQDSSKHQDILVVCFGAAQMALVAYDNGLERLTTLSIHNFDADAIGPGSGGVESGYSLASALKDRPPTISAFDPDGRCLAAVLGGCQLVVLPTLRHIPRSVFLSEEARTRATKTRSSSRRGEMGNGQVLPGGNHAKIAKDGRETDPAENGGEGRESGSLANGSAHRTGSKGSRMKSEFAGSVRGSKWTLEGRESPINDFEFDGQQRKDEGKAGEGAEKAGGGKEDAGLANGGSRVAGAHWTVSKPFTVDLEEAGVSGNIKAAAFLNGFHEPALALLYEPIQTCAGRLAKMRSTCRLVLLSLNHTQGRSPAIWRVDDLPHDSWNLVPVPSPIGGVQVISTNAVLHVNQSEVYAILAVNGYARATVDDALLGCPLRVGDKDWGWASFRHSHSAVEVVDLSSYDLCVELDSASCVFLTPTSLLITVRGGEVYALRLHLASAAVGETGRGRWGLNAPNRVVGQSMRPIGLASPCSALAVSVIRTAVHSEDGETSTGGMLGNDLKTGDTSTGLIFMGSRVGDSLLVKYAVASAVAELGSRGSVRAKQEPKIEETEQETALDDGTVGSAFETDMSKENGGVVGKLGASEGKDQSFGDVARQELVEAPKLQETSSAHGIGGDDLQVKRASDAKDAGSNAAAAEGAAAEPMDEDPKRNSTESTPIVKATEMCDIKSTSDNTQDAPAGDIGAATVEVGRASSAKGDVNVDPSEETTSKIVGSSEGKALKIVVPGRALLDPSTEVSRVDSEAGEDANRESVKEATARSKAPERSTGSKLSRTASVEGIEAGSTPKSEPPPSPASSGKRLTRLKRSGSLRKEPQPSPRSRQSSSLSGDHTPSPRLTRGMSDSSEVSSPSATRRSARSTRGKRGKLGASAGDADNNDDEDADGSKSNAVENEHKEGRTADAASEIHAQTEDHTNVTVAQANEAEVSLAVGVASAPQLPSTDMAASETASPQKSADVRPSSRSRRATPNEAQQKVTTSREPDDESEDEQASLNTPMGQSTVVPMAVEQETVEEPERTVSVPLRTESKTSPKPSDGSALPAPDASILVGTIGDDAESDEAKGVNMDVDAAEHPVSGTASEQDAESISTSKRNREDGNAEESGDERPKHNGRQGNSSDGDDKNGSRDGTARNDDVVLPEQKKPRLNTATSDTPDAAVAGTVHADHEDQESEPPPASLAPIVKEDKKNSAGKVPAAAEISRTMAFSAASRPKPPKSKMPSETVTTTPQPAAANPAGSEPSSSKQSAHRQIVITQEDIEIAEEEELLYGERLDGPRERAPLGAAGAALAGLGSGPGERVIEAVGFRLKVVDSLCTLGPITDGALVPSAYHVPKPEPRVLGGGRNRRHNRRGGGGGRGGAAGRVPGRGIGETSGGGIRTSLVCPCGYGKQGALAVFSAGLRTEVMVDLSMSGATGVYTVFEGDGYHQHDSLVLVSASHTAGGPAAADAPAGEGHTRVLAFGADSRVAEVEEGVDGNPFFCDAPTVDVCAMAGRTILQAHPQGLRVARDRQAVQDMPAGEEMEMGGLGAEPGATLLRASAAGAYACCLLSGSRLRLMALEEGDEGEAELLPAVAEEGAGGHAVIDGEGGPAWTEMEWDDVEAMCMFGVREQLGVDASATTSGEVKEDGGLFFEGVGDGFHDEGTRVLLEASEAAGDAAHGGYSSEDEEWATLYGARSSGGAEASATTATPSNSNVDPQDQALERGWWGGRAWSQASADATAYIVLCRRGGALDIFACGDRGMDAKSRPVFRTREAVHAPATLWNEMLAPSPSAVNKDKEGDRADDAQLKSNGHSTPMEDEDDESGGGKDVTVATGLVNGRLSLAAKARVGEAGDGEDAGDDADLTGLDAPDGDEGSQASSPLGGEAKAPSSDPMDVENTGNTDNSGDDGDSKGDGENPGSNATDADTAVEKAGLQTRESAAGTGISANGNAERQGGAAARTPTLGDDVAAAALAVAVVDDVPCPAVVDVIVHPVGAVDGPPTLRRLVLAIHLDNGDLLVYEARMSKTCERHKGVLLREQVVCFSKLAHDFITRPVKGIPREAAMPDPGRGRALRGVRFAAGQEGVCFARPGCRSALILAERGAVTLTPIAQDDLGDGSGSPPLPPGAPPSWAGVGIGSLAPLLNRRAIPGGGFASITAGGGRLRFVSMAPAASQLVTPGASGGGGLGGGGQGHFVAAKIGLGATVHGLVHLPRELVQPGKAGDILRGLLKKGHYVALVSSMVDALVEETETAQGVDDDQEEIGGEDEEVEGPTRHIVKHKNWTVADPALGGAPPLMVHKFELRVLALAPGAGLSSSTKNKALDDDEGSDDDNEQSDSNDQGEVSDHSDTSKPIEEEAEGGRAGRAAQPDTSQSSRKTGNVDHGIDGVGALPGELLSAATVESHPLESDENGLCVSLVTLEQGGSPRMYVAVGTGMNDSQGEDKAARGRLLLFEVDYAYLAKEDGGHEYAVKLRQVFAKEQLGPVSGESGPVSALAQLGRHLILSVGKKVIVNRWDPKSSTLELIGFHDPHVYVVSLSVIKKKFVLVGDVYGSVQLVVWREEDHSLTPLSKDHEDCEVFSAEYLVDEPGMGIVVSDGRRNIKVLQYAPKAPESRGGTKLLCQSDFYLGSRVAKLTRRRTRGNLRGGARYCLLAGTLDGGLGVVLPVDERVFRRLYALQGIMSNALGHTGAANPRAYRLYDHGPTFRHQSSKNMLDGTLLWRFVGLDARTQHDLTRAIGTTVDRVMANLLDIDLASLF